MTSSLIVDYEPDNLNLWLLDLGFQVWTTLIASKSLVDDHKEQMFSLVLVNSILSPDVDCTFECVLDVHCKGFANIDSFKTFYLVASQTIAPKEIATEASSLPDSSQSGMKRFNNDDVVAGRWLKRVQMMDLNMSGFFFHGNDEISKDDSGDTSLCLNSIGYCTSKNARPGDSQRNTDVFSCQVPDDGCRLVLGLGPTPSLYSGDYNSTGINKSKDSVTIFGQGFTLDNDPGILKLGLSRGTENIGVLENSGSDDLTVSSFSQVTTDGNRRFFPIVDEGSTSAKKSGGYMPSLILAPRLDNSSGSMSTLKPQEIQTSSSHHHHAILSPEPSITTGYSMGMFSESLSTRASSDQRSHLPRKCKFEGCSKGARGASGLCIAHGGGQRCQKQGCNKGAESRTAYCKAHGGGRRCQRLGCTKSAEGKTDYCIAHGGGRRCGHPGCNKAARGRSGLCIRHGGGKRCKVEGCTRSAEGHAGLCISHGGGRRCQYPECTKGAQGSTAYCKAHGGGKRCIFAGCTKGAEGSTPLCKGHGGGKRCLYDGGGICPKSVHGGTDYCVAHGGGKRCAISGCTKSARGRTDYCVRHGGGKRCRFENCGKSAQGSTDFCKAHGGGKRCTWGQGACEKFARGKSGLCAAHGSMVQDRDNNKGSMIGPDLFHGLVNVPAFGSSYDNDYSSSGISAVSDCTDSAEKPSKRQQLIPPQVLVPLSMKSSSSCGPLGAVREGETGIGGRESKNFNFVIPEGRVHGGGLLSLLGGNLKNAIDI
ncbi:hypothetical protein IFM89_038683 [Coptis chinensis]|uniref:WRKY19-like zinc finger domain-containing protein n=1 Tax=Coptis chinensis TaxID=261450 RepID=A0A835I7N0_9MAGN|nr:hypothetical protein IFM89_038683 [Coptis chinensis]